MRWPRKAKEGTGSNVQAEFDTYQVHLGWLAAEGAGAPFAGSPVRPLYQDGELARDLAELRRMLAADDSPETKAALQSDLARGIDAFTGAWFQRIDFPGHVLTSTSDHRWAYLDEGGLNTLGGRLTGDEASILRPWPKWTYFLSPVFGLLRILKLARETVVLDTGIHDVPGHQIQLSTAWRRDRKGLIYHSYLISEGLLLDLLGLLGVEPARIQRYKTPPEAFHAVYVIDTRGLEESRRGIEYPEYLRAALDLQFKTGEP